MGFLLLAGQLAGRALANVSEERVKLLAVLPPWLTGLFMQENNLRSYSALRKDPGPHLIYLLARPALF